jgi:hypothetical protein
VSQVLGRNAWKKEKGKRKKENGNGKRKSV